jgi:hypothetical protein
MGGYGSGRRRARRTTTSSYCPLDVRRWQREWLLSPSWYLSFQWSHDRKLVGSINVRTETGHVILAYKHRSNDESWQRMEYPVSISWTACHYGGARAWFICPVPGCKRRVAILYIGLGVACRHCFQLAYDSQRESASNRATRRAQRIRMRLGGSANMFLPFPVKPRGMHLITYERLRREEAETSARSWPTWLLNRVSCAVAIHPLPSARDA